MLQEGEEWEGEQPEQPAPAFPTDPTGKHPDAVAVMEKAREFVAAEVDQRSDGGRDTPYYREAADLLKLMDAMLGRVELVRQHGRLRHRSDTAGRGGRQQGRGDLHPPPTGPKVNVAHQPHARRETC